MNDPRLAPQTATLDEAVDTTGVTASDHRAERAIAARTLHAVADDLLLGGDAATTNGEIALWLRSRANAISHDQWSI